MTGLFLIGTSGSDELFGTTEVDAFKSFDGNDWLLGGIGGDQLDGGAGIDIATHLYAMLTADLEDPFANTGEAAGDSYISIEGLSGTRFVDSLAGNAVDNFLYGFAGDDTLIGRGGNDYLDGGAGNDFLQGGTGGDMLIGGAGFDTISYQDATAGVTVNLLDPCLNSGDAAGDSFSGIESIYGSNFNDVLTAGGDDNWLFGFDGDDILVSQGQRNRLEGGAGNDILVYSEGQLPTIMGGAGNDFINFGNWSRGVDATTLQSNSDYVRFDSIEGLSGSQYNDRLVAGSSDNSFLYGQAGNDTLSGQGGNDVLDGGTGDDFLVGGIGSDMFIFGIGYGHDTIADFSRVSDLIRLSPDLGVDSFADIQGLMTQAFNSVVITFDNQTSLTIANVTIETLTDNDFGFF